MRNRHLFAQGICSAYPGASPWMTIRLVQGIDESTRPLYVNLLAFSTVDSLSKNKTNGRPWTFVDKFYFFIDNLGGFCSPSAKIPRFYHTMGFLYSLEELFEIFAAVLYVHAQIRIFKMRIHKLQVLFD